MIRQNPKVTEDKEQRLIQLRGDYEACREILQLKELPGWGRIRAILDANIKSLKLQRADFSKLTDEGVRYILKEEQDLEFFKDLVDDCEGNMEQIQEDINLLQGQINERKRPVTSSSNPGL